MKQSIYETQMAALLKAAKYPFVQEYKFHPIRRWRFDFVLKPVKTKIAIEVEGGQWIKGKHNWGNNFTKDCEKYNQAQLLGWIVLRYTPDNLPDIIKDLKTLAQK